jgi:hypothetical protein
VNALTHLRELDAADAAGFEAARKNLAAHLARVGTERAARAGGREA